MNNKAAQAALTADTNCWNRCVLSRRPKLAMLRSVSRRLLPSAFQTVGPTTANARRPHSWLAGRVGGGWPNEGAVGCLSVACCVVCFMLFMLFEISVRDCVCFLWCSSQWCGWGSWAGVAWQQRTCRCRCWWRICWRKSVQTNWHSTTRLLETR